MSYFLVDVPDFLVVRVLDLGLFDLDLFVDRLVGVFIGILVCAGCPFFGEPFVVSLAFSSVATTPFDFFFID